MLVPISDSVASPNSQFILPEGHPKLTQIAKLIDHDLDWGLSARECVQHLPMAEAQLANRRHAVSRHDVCKITYICPQCNLVSEPRRRDPRAPSQQVPCLGRIANSARKRCSSADLRISGGALNSGAAWGCGSR